MNKDDHPENSLELKACCEPAQSTASVYKRRHDVFAIENMLLA